MSFDAVIATGSNNSEHFDYYFKDSKELLEETESIAVLDGNSLKMI